MNYFNDLSFIFINKHVTTGYKSHVIENSSYSLEFIRQGCLFLTINGKQYTLQGPVAFWMTPGNTYQFLAANDLPVEHIWADFYGFRAERMIKSMNQRIPRGMITVSNPDDFARIFENMLKIYREYSISRHYEAVVCLERLVGLIHEFSIENEYKAFKYDFIIELAEAINRSPVKRYDFKKIANRNGLSYAHFRRLFKQYNGQGPYDYVLSCRMEYATELLKEGKLHIKEVAYKCGFDEISSFSRMFKKKMGISPGKYIRTFEFRKRLIS